MNMAWWTLPFQIACGLLLTDVVRAIARFVLGAVATR